ncbi:HAMP domain-containing sensor histidine kinase [Sulfurovum sp. zt1-1]|uniref:histidine kinase n=1 Tax=Sulfurovum zhangzhouensis TaxID=3019067 RepID=A0ABT7R131_9BACT|nr:HAMP domain-containing sensor histidine kinase [Sulfurovum zhangzhouensis]MDM5272737.1 HAMP domain-containing sensor histidine kinase [Sulfurovum zhangzhouensis]
MIFDVRKFSRRYAIIYTAMIAAVLIIPLITYIVFLLQIDEAKAELSLEKQAKKIIISMQHYKNSDQIYHFPRYQEYTAALYDENFKSIFSTLQFEPRTFTEGFHHQKTNYYYIYEFADDYYFGATYLLVSKKHTHNKIYFFAFSVMAAVIVVLFIFSLLLLKNFSAPFETMNTHLDNFIKDSMHEINTPLSIINLNADLFGAKYGENKYLWRIKAASKTLATIYSDMDYLVKQGRVQHKIKEIDFGEFVQNRVDYFQVVANMKNIKLKTDITPGIIYHFSTTKLQRIVDNTISNAIKYSHDNDEVEIIVKESDESIEFTVKDHGVGIANTDKIFSRYYRENDAKGGFGIGLNIVKQIIDEEGVTLQVSSKINNGAIFSYKFYKQK